MMAGRRVALVIGQLQMGGAERQLFELAVRLDRSRWDPVVVCLSEVAEPFAGRLAERGIAVDVLPRAAHYDPWRVLRLARLLRRRRIDLAHSFLLAANAYVWAATRVVPGPRSRIPYIASSRTCIPPASGGLRLIHRRAFSSSTAIIANGARVMEFTHDVYGQPRDRIRVIPNGVDLAPFDRMPRGVREETRAELGIPRESLAVGTLGRLSPEKNLTLFLEMAGRILATGLVASSTGPPRFVIAGAGPELDRLRAHAATLGIGESLIFAGPRRDVPRLLAALDLFVLSSDTEGLPNAVMEAMAARLAVVATRAGGTDELVEEGATGLLVPVGDATALTAAVEALLREPGTRERMGEEGRRRIEGEFSVGRMVSETSALYDEVLR